MERQFPIKGFLDPPSKWNKAIFTGGPFTNFLTLYCCFVVWIPQKGQYTVYNIMFKQFGLV